MNGPRRSRTPRGGLLIVIGICLFLLLVSSLSPGFSRVLRDGIGTVQIGRAHVWNSSHLYISYAVFCLKKN